MPDVLFPRKLQFLFRPYRYKVARGGRGSAKSWSFARALLVLGAGKTLRVLCAREVQLSIKQSVHQLLKDQVEALDLGSHYRVLDAEIRGRNGTLFNFTGLSSLTTDTIKSFEGFDICWVEEGQAISKRSWDILIPTIRKEGSEIWVSYNPDLETDETHQRFTIHPPPGCYNQEVNFRDNPWFTDVLEQERRHCQAHDPEGYPNIWEGQCRPAVEGAIYYKQIAEAQAQGRVCNVPPDPLLKTHIVLDLGWADSLAAGLVQRHASEYRIIEYVEAHQTRLDIFFSELETRRHNWGRVWLPHDGFSKTLSARGKSTADIIEALGWDVVPRNELLEMSIEEGIRRTRLDFHRMYFDKERCSARIAPTTAAAKEFKHTPLSHRLIEILRRYRRHINRQTEAAGSPVRDQYAHGADMLRYLANNAENMHNEAPRPNFGPNNIERAGVVNAGGWMR